MKKIFVISSLLVLIIVFSLLLSTALVSAQISTPKIKVTLVNQDPDPVQQNDVVDVRFKVENSGSATSDNVFMQILPEYPFSLYSGDAVQDLGKLRAGQSGADAVIVRYKLKVDKYAQKGDNEIKLQLKIGSGVWQTYTDNNFFINVEKYDLPAINVYLKESTVNAAGQKGTVTLEVANAGKADVKFLQLTLGPNNGYQILSPSNYVYVGSVTSDDTQTEDFDVYTDKNASGLLTLPVNVKYQDVNDKSYDDNFSVSLRVYGSSELTTLGFTKSSNLPYIVLIIVLIAALWFYLRSRRK